MTDPPAGLHFLGCEWDYHHGGREKWIALFAETFRECLRVMKPGAHGFVWALPRLAHWTMTALEDAGFEIRDVVTHLFPGGLPKSHDAAKIIDKRRYTREEKVRACAWIADRCDALGLSTTDLDAATGRVKMGQWWASRNPRRVNIPTAEHWVKLEPLLGEPPDWFKALLRPARKPNDTFYKRKVVGVSKRGIGTRRDSLHAQKYGFAAARTSVFEITAPASEAAKKWQGWGTALRPGSEQWILVRKPFVGSVADSLLTNGTGALNIDGGRFDGRFPSNAILDGDIDLGDAERFFYCLKPSETERNMGGVNNEHPTVKPVALMRYLIALITPPGGVILDPFMGSGSTGIAAREGGWCFIGMEQDKAVCAVAASRIQVS